MGITGEQGATIDRFGSYDFQRVTLMWDMKNNKRK
jgi:hypothetical protein